MLFCRFSLSCDVEPCKLLWQAPLWGRIIKHCAIKLCLDVYGFGLRMAIKKMTFLKVLGEMKNQWGDWLLWKVQFDWRASLLARIRGSGSELDAVSTGCTSEIWWIFGLLLVLGTFPLLPGNINWFWKYETFQNQPVFWCKMWYLVTAGGLVHRAWWYTAL